MERVSGKRAQEILREEIAKFSSRIDFMMDIKKTTGPRNDARLLSWWMKDFIDTESATTDRNIAFLRAYRRIAGEKLHAMGLPLADRGSVYMDRSVIRRLYRDEYLVFIDALHPYFELTAAGEELIAE